MGKIKDRADKRKDSRKDGKTTYRRKVTKGYRRSGGIGDDRPIKETRWTYDRANDHFYKVKPATFYSYSDGSSSFYQGGTISYYKGG